MTSIPLIDQRPKRILWIDYAKFIAIFFVIFAHQTLSKSWFNFISGFDLPLFFFLSGYLFSFKKYENYKAFLKARVRQLLIPYLILNLVTYVLWLIFFKDFDPYYYTKEPLYKQFIGIFYGNGIQGYLIHSIASWFIICLFVLENMYFLAFRKAVGWKKVVILFGFFILAILDHKFIHFRLPWSINVAIVAILFYAAGNMLKVHIDRFVQLSIPLLLAVFISSFAVLYYATHGNYVDMDQHVYYSLKLFYIGAFSGIICAISFCRIIELLIGPVSLVLYIAKNTLVIIAFHIMLMSLITHVFAFWMGFSIEVVHGNNLWSFLTAVVTLFLCIPLIYVTDRYFPVMVGKPGKAKGLKQQQV
ncbi:hypothetical protein PBAL39_01447 [Pedobacter sp. BAL39]|uniref:acyltransferase family protein n=1 Tax=Pedobacter sp. BAL39 TaxID=391596 RepID=UPI00015595C5|nr:acyltransferase family protein [Pedobacter sp. BAL39]EDM38238.1 hypothetical protein PBAL39_01447 [Pedobacter sp. BAL39]